MALALTSSPPAASVPLASLAPGETGVVAHLDGDSATATRLADLGFLPGTAVHVRRRAPLGDPVEYELRGFRICLRRAEALQIAVRPMGSDAE